MVSRSALYDPVWPHMAPVQASYGPIQNPHSGSSFKGDSFPDTASQDTPKCSAQQAEENASFETS